ncbi:hypothetical protein DBR06_SOUSAS50410012 [Sousa chinensis]|uniref:Uncharacterized protein n=1 Tax=Sousa chinensis TaxID=103600 RepID=A0A484GLA9_SOUCH|nr:hypothetical protein DBR06_SOUSAS50410012 [Sousa chinensis]
MLIVLGYATTMATKQYPEV